MCGRYTLMKEKAELEGYFDAVMDDFESFGPNYNVSPTHRMPVVGANEDGRRTIRPFRWGLLPFWAKEKKISYNMINARGESVHSKKSYKGSFKRKRCLVPASGFYEWTGKKGDKTPYYIYPTHEDLFSFAGIYTVWEAPDGEKVPTYSIITTQANDKMNKLHDRMPVMLLKEQWNEWLDPGNQNTQALKELLQPFPDDGIEFHRVGKAVGNVRNNSPELIEAV